MLSDRDFRQATGEDPGTEFKIDALDIASGASAATILTFIDDPEFLTVALENERVKVILVTADIAAVARAEVAAKVLVVVADPRWSFYTFFNYVATSREEPPATQVHADAVVSELAWVAPRGVVIGPGCIIEPFAALHPGVVLGAQVVVRPHAVLGSVGFEHKRTSRGVVSVVHDGGVRIGDRTEIGSHVNVAQGFLRRETEIGTECRIDSMTHIAHGCQIADRVFIAAGVILSGSVSIGADAWLGPGVVVRDQMTIGSRARVAIGALVLRDVADGARVAGHPARGQI